MQKSSPANQPNTRRMQETDVDLQKTKLVAIGPKLLPCLLFRNILPILLSFVVGSHYIDQPTHWIIALLLN